MTRGYSIVALDNPKFDNNVGGVLRAAQAFGANGVCIGGKRLKREPTDTGKAWKHIPVTTADNVLDLLPFGCVPIAVEIVDWATPLYRFVHPERAFYVFGAEDATVGSDILSRCRGVVAIPTKICLNLAMTVNVVLYDRAAKLGALSAEASERRQGVGR